MSGFNADWLALREAFDALARAAALSAFDLRTLPTRREDEGPAVLDLACGTGANLRALAPRLGPSQRWLLTDHDPRLLAALPAALDEWAAPRGVRVAQQGDETCLDAPGWSARVRVLRIDLARDLASLDLSAFDLVSASALLDLVSAPWLERLLGQARAARTALLFGLSVDGRIEWNPAIDGDAQVARLFAAHQLRDKGFGAALGGAAVAQAARSLEALGYAVRVSPSDWDIDAAVGGASAQSMLAALIDGMRMAAVEQDPSARALIDAWAGHRTGLIEGTRLRIGHHELLASLS